MAKEPPERTEKRQVKEVDCYYYNRGGYEKGNECP